MCQRRDLGGWERVHRLTILSDARQQVFAQLRGTDQMLGDYLTPVVGFVEAQVCVAAPGAVIASAVLALGALALNDDRPNRNREKCGYSMMHVARAVSHGQAALCIFHAAQAIDMFTNDHPFSMKRVLE